MNFERCGDVKEEYIVISLMKYPLFITNSLILSSNKTIDESQRYHQRYLDKITFVRLKRKNLIKINDQFESRIVTNTQTY